MIKYFLPLFMWQMLFAGSAHAEIVSCRSPSNPALELLTIEKESIKLKYRNEEYQWFQPDFVLNDRGGIITGNDFAVEIVSWHPRIADYVSIVFMKSGKPEDIYLSNCKFLPENVVVADWKEASRIDVDIPERFLLEGPVTIPLQGKYDLWRDSDGKYTIRFESFNGAVKVWKDLKGTLTQKGGFFAKPGVFAYFTGSIQTKSFMIAHRYLEQDRAWVINLAYDVKRNEENQ